MGQRLKSSGIDGLHTGTDAGFQWRSRQKASGRQMLVMKRGFDSFVSRPDPAESVNLQLNHPNYDPKRKIQKAQ